MSSLPGIYIFTDGSASPNGSDAAHGGYSMVAYDYDGIEFKEIERYSCAVPSILGRGSSTKIRPTNIRMEAMALIAALMFVNDYRSTQKYAGLITIMTDSQFWIDMINKYMPKWKKDGIDFAEKQNPDLTTVMYKLSKATDYVLKFTPAHRTKDQVPRGDAFELAMFEGNAAADKLANDERLRAVKDYPVSADASKTAKTRRRPW